MPEAASASSVVCGSTHEQHAFVRDSYSIGTMYPIESRGARKPLCKNEARTLRIFGCYIVQSQDMHVPFTLSRISNL
eukprot:2456790-Pleurochrysis_carterae.AAC.7